MASKFAPIVDRIRIIPRPDDFLDRNVGSSGEVFFDKAANTLRVYNGNLAGGYSVLTSNNLSRHLETSGVSTVRYNVTVGTDPDGIESGNKYFLNGEYKPALTLVVGYTYIFNQDNQTNIFYPNPEGGTNNQHPINFSADDPNGELGSGTSYLTNVFYRLDDDIVSQQEYNDRFQLASARSVLITITSDTPTTLYYWCTRHTNMGNTIEVANPGAGGGASVEVLNTAPEDPENGDVWFNSDTGTMYVYVQDNDSAQWVQPTGVTIGANVSVVEWVDVAGKPTIPTDINQLSDSSNLIPNSLTDLGIVDGTVGQILTTNGAGVFTFEDAPEGGGSDIDLTAFSVSVSSPSGSGNLTYNNTNGIFTFTPANLSVLDNASNWDTAFSWGDHAQAGYLTSAALVESDTLATVTGRGATTTTTLSVVDVNSTGTISADAFTLGGTGTPELSSASTLTLDSADGVLVTGTGAFRLPNLTETQRNDLTPSNGDVIYNVTSAKIEAYQNGTWIELDTGAAA